MVLVVPYDPAWPGAFESIRARILEVFVGVEAPFARVEHVGSTSVPGLLAKPIIDVDVVVAARADVTPAIEALARIGYAHQGDLGVAGREALRPPPDSGPTHHLYVVVESNQAHRDHVDLRDHLRTHPAVATEYATLKTALGVRFPTDGADDRAAYTDAKAGFIQSVLAAARAGLEK